MSIDSTTQIPKGHFSGGRNLTGETADDLGSLLRISRARAFVGLNPDQTSNVAPVSHIEFNKLHQTGNLVSISSGTGQELGKITLAAGHTYELTVAVGLQINPDTTAAFFEVFNLTTGARMVADGDVIDLSLSLSGPTAANLEKVGLNTLAFEFTAAVQTDFEIRLFSLSIGGGITAIRPNTRVRIVAMD